MGGIMGGMGMALMGHSVVDGGNGRVPNANFAEYAVPVHADAPSVMDVIFVGEHDPHVNPLGVKASVRSPWWASGPRLPTQSFTPPENVSANYRSRRTNSFERDTSRSPESRTMSTRIRLVRR